MNSFKFHMNGVVVVNLPLVCSVVDWSFVINVDDFASLYPDVCDGFMFQILNILKFLKFVIDAILLTNPCLLSWLCLTTVRA